ncbi:glycoside hydrolase [Leifsonia sp. Leaf336]|uniref:glycoside hydrolase family 2 TIM barrel-domain containing protein n=1 Tax=Leifsonia sp. Leaf336 TaxID=1736341 RepID=UPI0006FF86F1|nr:glycoside hydrolase family 2 TIM barrel-domain containing protein [Leifsonia sp. Leaf336]KQR50794.1 glycoside hydrolase [Leifsonia sp. Leaf336]
MKRTSFNDGWQYREKVNPFAELAGISALYNDITLPHDAQIGRDRDPEGDRAVAFFPAGAYQYRKSFLVPSEFEGKRIVVEFEGVYRDATVHINGSFAGQRPYGYSGFTIDADTFLRPGEENTIEVEARNGEDSRWYTGAGIYRNVWLHVGPEVHIPADGLRVTTPDVEADAAIVEVDVTVSNTRNRRATVSVSVNITDPSGATVATGTVPVTVEANGSALSRQRLRVGAPALWSAEAPALYTAHAELSDDAVIDQASSSFGIRKLQVDPVRGLRVNGQTVKLRGACIHHDNGILGAATFDAAEERRVRLLKEAGFNAIRSAHNPISAGLLEACDRLGMYVMDETFDMWTSGKMSHDYSLRFAEWWERDVEAMVAKDFNHPSVILYSIGNEIPETGSAAGGITGRALAEKVRALDSTRFVTNAVNGMLAVMDDLKAMGAQRGSSADEGAGINTMMASGPGDFMNQIGSSPLVTEKTAESFGLLDIAGMNYLDARYVMDKELFPNRVIVGTETFPTHIDHNWGLVTDNAHVIGDFTWTGFDYLGEVGIGAPQYLAEGEQPTLSAGFPWIAAWCGDLDLIGGRRPASFYREIVFGLRPEPYIAVNRPGRDGTFYAGPWTWSDSIASWTWSGHEGATLTVEVYSDADEVELALNGAVIGRAAAGREHAYRAEFPVAYTPGTLVATAIRNGIRAESYTLTTAGPAVQLLAEVDAETADGIRFVRIGLADGDGRIVSDADRPVTVELEGEAKLLAVGSGNPAPADSYVSRQHTSFDGHALAVVQLAGDEHVDVTITAYGLTAARLSLSADGVEFLDRERSLSAAG